jgi:DNA end-binding protein Ku
MATRKGILTFGLVSIPVEFHVAARPKTLDLDLLHRPCKTRIQYQVYCPTHDRAVDRKDLVKGYKRNGGYVLMDDADFDKAERAATRAIEVLHFVAADDVDPIYLDRSYYLAPQPDLERPYRILLAAMRGARKAAIVTFVMHNRQQVALVRPDEGVLVLHTLYHADEVQEAPAAGKRARPGDKGDKEVQVAEQLISALTRPFDPGAYKDEYRETLLAIIRAKAEGETIEVSEAPAPPGKVIDLMAALRASVEQVRKPLAKVRREARPTRARRRSARRRSA